MLYTPFTQSSKYRANIDQTSSKNEAYITIAYIKQTSSKHRANIEQTSSRRQAISTCILNTFARCLLDDCLIM